MRVCLILLFQCILIQYLLAQDKIEPDIISMYSHQNPGTTEYGRYYSTLKIDLNIEIP
jgi:hypothetical protein